jgi:hypothetical protein
MCPMPRPHDFFGERDCSACISTGSVINIKQPASDQDRSTALGPLHRVKLYPA